eukprot:gene19039-20952_t
MPTKLYVANLSPNCTETDLHGLFSEYGMVSELDIVKNYAFVHMQNHADAQRAVAALNNHSLHGYDIQVQFSRIQSINRSNKSSMSRQERVDGNFRGRGHNDFGGREGFQGRIPGFRGSHGGDHRGGRGGFHGDRGGMHRGRGKPYERPFNQNPNFQDQMQNSNVQPIRAIGSGPAAMARLTSNQVPNVIRPVQHQLNQQLAPHQQVRPQIHINQKQHLPTAAVASPVAQAYQAQVYPAQLPVSQVQQPIQLHQTPLQQVATQPQLQMNASLQMQQQANPLSLQAVTPGQPTTPFNNTLLQNQQIVQQVRVAAPQQQILNSVPVAASTPMHPSQPRHLVPNQLQVMQQTFTAARNSVAGQAIQQQAATVPNAGLGVYDDRFGNYRSPMAVQTATAYQQLGQIPAGQVSTSKDLYLNTQLQQQQFERYLTR